jgi:hypothetical protein
MPQVRGHWEPPRFRAPRVTLASDPGGEHSIDEGGTLRRTGGKPAIASLVTTHARAVLVARGQPTCSCPEWHVLRMFGHGRHRASFEAGDDRLVSPEVDSVCAVCGHVLRTMARAQPSPGVGARD